MSVSGPRSVASAIAMAGLYIDNQGTPRTREVAMDTDTNDGMGMNLTDAEVRAVALRLIARHVVSTECLEWGDVPNLGEHAFERLVAAWDEAAADLMERSNLTDQAYGIDSQALLERAMQ